MKVMILKITILGTGAFGLAIGNLLHNKSNAEIKLWTNFEEEYLEITNNNTYNKVLEGIKLANDLQVTMDLEEALENTNLIIVAVPCNHVREVLNRIKEFLSFDSKIVLVSKGLETSSNLLMIDIFKELNLKGKVSYLAGPTFAKELITNSISGLTLATTDNMTKEIMTSLFKDTNVDLEITEDYIGLELYGVIKNIMAILMGSINSKYKEDSTNAYYLTKIYNYTKNIVIKLGGKEKTASCYGALGDILLTCNSKTSRNYVYGTLLYTNKEGAKDYLKNVTVEGAIAITALKQILDSKKQSSLFFDKLESYFKGNIDLDDVLKEF